MPICFLRKPAYSVQHPLAHLTPPGYVQLAALKQRTEGSQDFHWSYVYVLKDHPSPAHHSLPHNVDTCLLRSFYNPTQSPTMQPPPEHAQILMVLQMCHKLNCRLVGVNRSSKLLIPRSHNSNLGQCSRLPLELARRLRARIRTQQSLAV